MIKRVFSTHSKFKAPSFDPGMNLLIVDKTEQSTVKQTRNSAGKSSLIEIINFVFGADNDKGAFYNKEAFESDLFSVEMEYSGVTFVASRGAAKKNRIYFNKRIDIDLKLDIDLEEDAEIKLFFSSVNDWKKVLGRYFFSISTVDTTSKYNPSFRSLFSYFVRREPAGGMLEPKKNARQQQSYDEQINLSFLFGLDWTLSSEFQVIRDKEKALKELKKSLKQGYLDAVVDAPANLRSQIAILEGKVSEMQANLRTFNLLPEYRQYENELTKIGIELRTCIDKNTIENELLDSLATSIEEASSPDYDSLQQLYQESLQVFPDIVKKRFDEVQAFHDSVVRNRKLYLQSEIERVKANISARNSKITDLTQRQTFIMDLLQTHGALEQYNKLNSDLLKKQAELEDLKKRLKTATDIEDAQPRLDMERAALTLKIGQNIQENSVFINKAIQRFESISSTLFEQTGLLTVENTANGIAIDVSKQGDKSKGIKSMQIYCFDMTLISLLREQGSNIDFLVHDSHLFDPVDSRQVAHALVTGAEFARKYNFQYIITMNSDQIPYDYLPKDFDIGSMIVSPRLTDKDDGGLFGFRF
ncbi:ABC-three component system protein [Caproiciproducens sp. R2]|uniref:ABC-three component system protein n=1 Tax=Caproiciproducens sp. R2 TaxID=3435187 RepID=UPI00403349E3